jgi:hypothetical protein
LERQPLQVGQPAQQFKPLVRDTRTAEIELPEILEDSQVPESLVGDTAFGQIKQAEAGEHNGTDSEAESRGVVYDC